MGCRKTAVLLGDKLAQIMSANGPAFPTLAGHDRKDPVTNA